MNPISARPEWRVGVARRRISPPPGVELAGLGYYLNRTWERLRDDLAATALVIEQGGGAVGILAVDLMYNDARFTAAVRAQAAQQIPLSPAAICVNCSHAHNAPTAGFIRGCGERDEAYLAQAARACADALVDAWRNLQPARLFVGQSELTGMTFNRTQPDGPVDTRVSVLRADDPSGKCLAAAVNFHAHCTAHMESDLRAVSRDWPGEVVDQLEAAMPGTLALYWQGTCGDTNFQRQFNGTALRFEPAKALTRAALAVIQNARSISRPGLRVVSRRLALPTRSWTRAEVLKEREEGLYRLRSGDTTGWMEGLGRACVNQPERLPLRYGGSVEKTVAALARFAVEWTAEALPHIGQPAAVEAELQALRIGDAWLVAHPAELFTSIGLDLRAAWPQPDLFMLGYSNGSIGYLPDAYEIARGGYAALQSPKCTGQSPFTPGAGTLLAQALCEALAAADAD